MTAKVVMLVILTVAGGAAQTSNGYVFFAPGGTTNSGHTTMTLHVGGGVDAIIAKGIGVNAEIGALWPRSCFSDCVLGVFSPGGTYYFRRGRENRLEPFVNGGYTLVFRGGHENLFYFGGGANYWMSDKLGVRLEFRDHVSTRFDTAHFWSFRVGLAVR